MQVKVHSYTREGKRVKSYVRNAKKRKKFWTKERKSKAGRAALNLGWKAAVIGVPLALSRSRRVRAKIKYGRAKDLVHGINQMRNYKHLGFYNNMHVWKRKK
jgi:hypothetical protein